MKPTQKEWWTPERKQLAREKSLQQPQCKKTTDERIADKFYIAENGCHIWTGHKGRDDYPKLTSRVHPTIRVHHYVLEKAGKPRPANLYALHSCDTPSCINPDHLRWGTQKENMAEAVARGRMGTRRRRAVVDKE